MEASTSLARADGRTPNQLRPLFGDAGGGDDSVPPLHLNSAVCPTPKAHVACAG